MENNAIKEYQGVKIIYEDNHILVAVKPQNMPSQEDESKDPDILSILKNYLKETYDKPGDAYLGLVHRLDRVTGGVMVFAKTSKAAARLSEAIREGEFEKTYLAVVYDAPKEKQAVLVNHLKRIRKAIPSASSRKSPKAQNMRNLLIKCSSPSGNFRLSA